MGPAAWFLRWITFVEVLYINIWSDVPVVIVSIDNTPVTSKSPELLVSETIVPVDGSPSLVIMELPSGPITIDIMLAPSINSIQYLSLKFLDGVQS